MPLTFHAGARSASCMWPHATSIGKDFSCLLKIFRKPGRYPAQIASLLALILAWVYIFDTVMKEREALENPQEGIVGAIPRDVESQVAPAPQPQPNQNGRSGDTYFCVYNACTSAHYQVFLWSGIDIEAARTAGDGQEGTAGVIALQDRV